MSRRAGAWAVAVVVLSCATRTLGWDESDFPVRPAIAYVFSLDPREPNTVIGSPKGYTFAKGDTLYDVARHLGLGINEVIDAFPDVEAWMPPEGESLPFPTFWVLPDSDYRGVVVNIPEMRLYYFPASSKPGARTVITYPVGLGRDDWRTPTGKFKVVDKTVDPPWIIPDSIREEHLVERGDPRRMIAGGAPDNPLGHYRMRLSLPLYGIHGTNIPWGVGMQVSHGCIRLYPEDIERLFAIVPLGSPGELVYQPVKIGTRDGDIYVEVHHDIYATGLDFATVARQQLHAKGWDQWVDPDLLQDALQRQSGVPTVVSTGHPLLRSRSEGPTEAAQHLARSAPRS